MFALSLSEFILSIHWIFSGLFSKHVVLNYDYPPDKSAFCYTNAIASSVSGTLIVLYNVCFSAYLVFAMRNTIKKSRIPNKTFHIFALTVASIVLAYLIVKERLGKTPYGTCSIATTKHDAPTSESFKLAPYIPVAVILVYMVISIYALYYVHTHIPEDSRRLSNMK